jgi:uncharacterized phage-associated protein
MHRLLLSLRFCVRFIITITRDHVRTDIGREERTMLRAIDVAKWIVGFSGEHGDPVTNLRLQKLLYYAQAWYLALRDEPLFGERIEAWVYGPVVPEVYRAFRDFGAMPISIDTESPEFSREISDHLGEIMAVFGGYSSYQLEIMTHNEAPWLKARDGIAPDEPSNAVIAHEDMKEFYRALAAQEA